MRKLLIAIFALWGFFVQTQAVTYYVSASGNDSNNGTSEATPWKTLTKVNASMASFTAGTNIVFKRGDVFYGTLVIAASGNASASITFGAYGTGSDPVISGSALIKNWTLTSGNIYQAQCDSVSGRIYNLLYNGAFQEIGRHPNSGYTQISTGSRTTLVDPTASYADNYWVGGDVVVRSSRWTTDRCLISANSGTSFTFSSATYGLNSYYGYFIINHINTLDLPGEWAFTSGKTLYFLAPAGFNPSNAPVEVSYYDYGARASNVSYVNIENLHFNNQNKNSLQLNYVNNVAVYNCTFTNVGVNGIDITYSTNIKVSDNVLDNVNNNGISFYTCDFFNCDNNSLNNIAMRPGIGQSGNTQYLGIVFNKGGDASITKNKLTNIGYNAIDFYYCSRTTIQNNYINGACLVKDDGGGIYTWGNKGKPIDGGGTETPDNKIMDNIILNVTGVMDGTYDQYNIPAGYGIYMDDRTVGVQVTGNTSSGCQIEYYFHNDQDMTICHNVALNKASNAMYFKHDQTDTPPIGMKIFKNVMAINNNSTLKLATYFKYQSAVEMLDPAINSIDSNYLINPYFNEVIRVTHGSTESYYTFPNWQSQRNTDMHGKSAPVMFNTSGIQSVSEFELFDYNATETPKVVTLQGQYVDKDGNPVSGSVTIQPYKSVILYKVKSTPTAIESLTPNGANKIWDIEFLNSHPNADVKIFDFTGRVVKMMKGREISSREYLKSNLKDMRPYIYVIDLNDGSNPIKGKMLVTR